MGADTLSGGQSIADFLTAVSPPERQADARRLTAIFAEVTAWPPVLWPGSIIGFGRYAYTYASGHSGESLATGFAPRKAECVIYIAPGFAGFGALLSGLGPHRAGKGCLYLKHLDRVDERVLRRLIRAGLDDLATRWDVRPS